MATIGDLGSEVVKKVENRTSDLTRTYQWVKEALWELSSSGELRDEFDELEVLGAPFVLTPGVREYDFSNLALPNDYNDGTLDIRLWRDPPTNSIFFRLNSMSFQQADNYYNKGMPSAWYRFADMFGFDMIPEASYQVQARYQRQHPISNPIESTTVLLPNDWLDVTVLVAAHKGFIELNEYEKAEALHTILFGDPRGNGKIGVIQRRKKRFEREAWRKEQPLRVMVPRYSPRTR
jgi:hypothetical protein